MNSEHHNIDRRLLMDSSSTGVHCEDQGNRTLSIFTAVFIMVTLICLLINSILKCLRRQNHPTTPTSNTTATELQPSSHCDDLTAIPVLTYGIPPSPSSSSSSSLPSCSSTSTSFESDNCVICLADFAYGDSVRVLPRCKHMFHKDCIDQWLPLRSMHCPVCRDRTIELHVELERKNCRNGGPGSPSALLALNFVNNAHIVSYI